MPGAELKYRQTPNRVPLFAAHIIAIHERAMIQRNLSELQW
jgi:hypothetical protein